MFFFGRFFRFYFCQISTDFLFTVRVKKSMIHRDVGDERRDRGR